MRYFLLSILLIISSHFFQLSAWDEVTHAYMTSMIPDLVQDPELKKLIEENLDEFIYGCWYTDTYQYTDERINTLNTHNIFSYGKAFLSYLRKEEVRKQDNYEKLVALYLGSLAHLLEDFWYDSNLNKYQKTKDDKYIGDSKHGAFVAKQHGYIGIKVKRYFPKEDLFRMYSEAGMIEAEYNSSEKFKKLLDDWSNQQYLLLRSLKLINFLGGNQMHNKSLWTAGNLRDIKGGMVNSAEVASKFIEATWNKLNQKPVNPILHSEYICYENKIVMLSPAPVRLEEISLSDVFLLNQSNDTITGKLDQFSHPDKKKEIAKYAFAFHPSSPLIEGERYKLILNPGAGNAFPGLELKQPVEYEFQTGTYIEKPAKKKPFMSTIGLGIFGFIPFLGLSGFLYGLGGIIKFNWHNGSDRDKMALSRVIPRILLLLMALISLAFGLYVLWVRGSMIISLSI